MRTITTLKTFGHFYKGQRLAVGDSGEQAIVTRIVDATTIEVKRSTWWRRLWWWLRGRR